MIILKPKTRKGENVIKNHGDRWEVIEDRGIVQFSNKKNWLLIRSEKTKDSRWIHASEDDNFIYERI